ncbi:capsule biosynthesis GfcC family protein [Vibrio atypicus]|uniref:capsule biosynthesis GfcC family protein n=1 Tax=Vibrio atypicus TaxID=558271 RepID=UPI0013598E1A|nr:capsule biosynthesis GfcC family protein [Vibrio atypicus]
MHLSSIKKVTALFFAGCSLITASNASAQALKVNLPSTGIALEYAQPQRIDQVFTDVIAQKPSPSPVNFPIANQLFNLEKQEQSEQFKQQVLKKLTDLTSGSGKQKKSIGILIEQIKDWQVGYRESITLDFDEIRLQSKANPMLSGEYEFIIPGRSNTVSFEGLLFSPQQVDFKSNQTLSDYLGKLNLLSSAHPSYAWVIYPNGHYIKAGYAYWNNDSTQLTPGSVVFLGYNSDTREMQNIEKDIVKLISMRKGTQ